MLISSEINLLEVELGALSKKQKELVEILSEVDFDFDVFEPVFVRFAGSEKHYIYQVRWDSLVELGDVLLVPVNGEENFKTATVLMTFELLNDKSLDDFDLSQVEHVVEKFKNVRHAVSNLGKINGEFFHDYFFEINRKQRREDLVKNIEKRAKTAKQAEYFRGIARYDSILQGLLEELDELGGF